MKEEILAEALKLSIQDRIVFVEDIWDSIANVPESVELTEAQKKELDKRLEEYHRNPDAGSPWDKVKSKLLAKNGKAELDRLNKLTKKIRYLLNCMFPDNITCTTMFSFKAGFP